MQKYWLLSNALVVARLILVKLQAKEQIVKCQIHHSNALTLTLNLIFCIFVWHAWLSKFFLHSLNFVKHFLQWKHTTCLELCWIHITNTCMFAKIHWLGMCLKGDADYDKLKEFILPLFINFSQFLVPHCSHTFIQIEEIYDGYLVLKIQMKRQHMPC